jgi:hypothetical protein
LLPADLAATVGSQVVAVVRAGTTRVRDDVGFHTTRRVWVGVVKVQVQVLTLLRVQPVGRVPSSQVRVVPNARPAGVRVTRSPVTRGVLDKRRRSQEYQ